MLLHEIVKLDNVAYVHNSIEIKKMRNIYFFTSVVPVSYVCSLCSGQKEDVLRFGLCFHLFVSFSGNIIAEKRKMMKEKKK